MIKGLRGSVNFFGNTLPLFTREIHPIGLSKGSYALQVSVAYYI
jgi:hypothetical protein